MQPKIGIFPNKKFSTYRGWDAANKSTIWHCLRSPAHAKMKMLEPEAPTAAMEFGTACHTIALEFQKFDRQYVKAPDVDRRTKVGKQTLADFSEMHPDKTLLAAADYDALLSMRQSLMDHPIASKLLKARGRAELSYVWESRYRGSEGMLCKARADRVTKLDGMPVLVDLKTCKDSSPAEFKRSVATFGYQMQAAFYADGLNCLEPAEYRFLFIAVEKTAPYAVTVCELDKASLEDGRLKAERAMALYAEAKETRTWSGYEPVIHEISTPIWSRTAAGSIQFD